MNGKIDRQPVEPALELPLSDLEWMRAQWLDNPRLDPLTLTNYSRKTEPFAEWWTQAGPTHNWSLTRSALQGFSNWLASKKSRHSTQGQALSFNTRKSVVNHVMQLLQWARRNAIVVGIDFDGWFPAIPGQPPTRRAATADQLAQLMTTAAGGRYPVRDQAILAFFIGTGCRLQEVALLTFENLQLLADGSGTALVRGKRTQANPTGRRNVGFDAATGKYLTAHIKWERITAGALWLNERGEPLAQAGIYQMVSRTVKRAGLAGVIRGCHDLRRAFATILGLMHPDSPAWADMIRRQLGHTSLNMTAHYQLLSADDIRARIISPLAPAA